MVLMRVDQLTQIQQVLATIRSSSGSPGFIAIVFIIGTIAGASLLSLRRRAKNDQSGASLPPHQYDDVLTALTTFGHSQRAGRNLDRIAFLSRNLPEDPDRLREIEPNIESALETYRAFTQKQLWELIAQSRRKKDLREHAASLRNQARRLESLIGSLSAPADLDERTRSVLRDDLPDTIAATKVGLRELRQVLYRLYSADLVLTLRDVLAACSSDHAREGIRCDQVTISGDVTHRVFFSQAALTAILDELFSNAGAAMSESAEKEIGVDVSIEAGEALVRVSDSGTGFDDADLQRVFDRSYSTKPDKGGYGLYHARTEVEKFDGRISVANREDRPGAVVELRLKLVPNED